VPPAPPPLAVPLYSWTGCHAGVNIGGGASPKSWTDTAGTFTPLATIPPVTPPPYGPGTPLGTHTARGVAGGWQLGCEYQAGGFVFGLEGRYDLSGMKADDFQPNGAFLNRSFIQTVGMFTGRIGYTVTPTVLLYGKGGGALVHDLYNVSTPPGVSLGSQVPFASVLVPGKFFPLDIKQSVNMVLVGMNWRFWGGNHHY